MKRLGSREPSRCTEATSHPWFSNKHHTKTAIDWQLLEEKRIKAPFVPKIKSPSDTSNFDKYPESVDKDVKKNFSGSGESDAFTAWSDTWV